MHSSPKSLALAGAAAALLSSTVIASPLQPSVTSASSSHNQTRAVNCTDVSTGLAPSCWFTLNMTGYLNDWVASNEYHVAASIDSSSSSTTTNTSGTTPTSGNPFAAGDEITVGTDPNNWFRKRAVAAPASGQCSGGKPFSTCFLQLLPGYRNGTDCSKINTGGAAVNGSCPAPKVADFPPQDPESYYAAWNFYCETLP